MRIAFVGKGGAGKSTIVGTFARLLARTGREIVAVDSDPMPGLSFALGLPVIERPFPDDCVVERGEGETGVRFRLRPGLDATSALEKYAVNGSDGVRYFSFGNTRLGADISRGQHAWSQILNELPTDRFHLVGDLPGGTRQPMTGWGKYADVLVVVAEASPASIETARHLATLQNSKWAYKDVVCVVNRAFSSGDAVKISNQTGLNIIGVLPLDDQVAAADRLGLSPLDGAPESPFVAAVSSMVEYCITHYDKQEAVV